MNPTLIIEIWMTLKSFIPQKDRLDAADHFISVFNDYDGLDFLDGESIEFDKELEVAYKTKYGIEDDYEY